VIAIIINNSKSDKAYKRANREIGLLAYEVHPGVFVGNIPQKTIFEMIKNIKQSSSKYTNVVVLTPSKKSKYGFIAKKIGSLEGNERIKTISDEEIKIPKLKLNKEKKRKIKRINNF